MRDTSSIMNLIYEAPFFPDRWPQVLQGMADGIGAQGTVFFSTRGDSSRWVASDGIAEIVSCFLGQGWHQRNTRAAGLISSAPHGFASDFDLFSEEQMDAQPIYTEFLRPMELGWGAATILEVPSGDNLLFSVEKRFDRGPVERADTDYLDQLRPHLARAALLSSRLEFERIQAALQALQLTGLLSAVLTSDGKLLAANRIFEDNKSYVSLLALDKIQFASPSANLSFRRTIEQRGTGNAASVASSLSFPIAGTEGTVPAIAHLLPITGDARDIFSRAAYFLIITPVDRSRVPSAEMIKGLFDLSAAEAKVASALVAGSDVTATAQKLSLSVDTVRSHVKSILAKAGMTRQMDFIAAAVSIRPIS